MPSAMPLLHRQKPPQSSLSANPGSHLARIAGQIDFRVEQQLLRLSFGRCFDENVGLTLRRRQAKRLVRLAFWPRAQINWSARNEAVIALTPEIETDSIDLTDLTSRLADLAKRPLTPKELLAALPLTNKERVRWTKDGRLPPSGAVSIRKGQIVSVPTYAVSHVERLRGAIHVISEWREQDARQSTDQPG